MNYLKNKGLTFSATREH